MIPAVAAVSASGPAPLIPRLLEDRRERETRGRPAHQRHRACHHAKQGVLIEGERDRDADEVLDQAEEHGQDQDEEH